MFSALRVGLGTPSLPVFSQQEFLDPLGGLMCKDQVSVGQGSLASNPCFMAPSVSSGPGLMTQRLLGKPEDHRKGWWQPSVPEKA